MVKISFGMNVTVERAERVHCKKKKSMIFDLAYAVKMRVQQKHLQYLVGSVLHWTIVENTVWVKRGG
jgi:hypothetical protein